MGKKMFFWYSALLWAYVSMFAEKNIVQCIELEICLWKDSFVAIVIFYSPLPITPCNIIFTLFLLYNKLKCQIFVINHFISFQTVKNKKRLFKTDDKWDSYSLQKISFSCMLCYFRIGYRVSSQLLFVALSNLCPFSISLWP